MPATILTRENWHMVSAAERGASPTARLCGMLVHNEEPHLTLLEEPPNFYTATHSHNQPEIMVVLEGRMILNGKWCEPGTVIYIPADEDYWHATGGERCVVALMRPTERGKTRRAAEVPAAVVE
jgi:quercetin dioxygenase-like cupin family protein